MKPFVPLRMVGTGFMPREPLIQGVSELTYKTYRGDGGGRGEQKIIWEGGSKMQPWGDMGKILIF